MKAHTKQHKPRPKPSQDIDIQNKSDLKYLEKGKSRNALEIFNCNMDENEVNCKGLTIDFTLFFLKPSLS